MGKGKRLTEYVEKQGFKKKEWCETNGLDYNSMVRIMADKMPMGIIVVDRIHNIFPKMNIHWLLYGEGPKEIVLDNNWVLNEPKPDYIIEKDFKNEFLIALQDEKFRKKVVERLTKK